MEAFCAELRSAQQQLGGVTASLGKPGHLQDKANIIVAELQQLQAGAPGSLQQDFNDLVSAFQTIAQVGGGGNPPAVASALRTVLPKLQRDGRQLEQFSRQNCGH